MNTCRGPPEGLLVSGALPDRIRYVIALDADTQLPPGTARRMVATIAHPLNRAELDPETRTRRRGYTIIQPRVSIALPGAIASRFTRIFAETGGPIPIAGGSDVQQDLFRRSHISRQGDLRHVGVPRSRGTRFPAETILSHDLIEGAHAGVGLASDIELFENLPHRLRRLFQARASLDSRATGRSRRGSWHVYPAADGRRVRNPLTPINRWRVFDNLRRSLVPVASVLLLLFGWLTGRRRNLEFLVGLAVVIPTLAPLMDRMARQNPGNRSALARL